MALTFSADKIKEIDLLPISAVTYSHPDGEGETGGISISLYNLEQGSTFTIDPVIVVDDENCERTLGWDVEITLYLLQNKYPAVVDGGGILAMLEAVRKIGKPNTMVRLGKNSLTSDNPLKVINATDSLSLYTYKNLSFSYKIEYSGNRPRVVIRQQGFILNLLDVQNGTPGGVELFLLNSSSDGVV